MNTIILRLTGRYISRRLLHSVLFVIGVALGVAIGVAIDLANGSANRAFVISGESISGRTTHQIVGGPGGLPSELYRQVRAELGIRASAPVIEAEVRSPDLGDQPLTLLGVDPFAEAPFRDYLTTTSAEQDNRDAFDALNAFIAEPDTVIISQTLAERFEIEVGDEILLQAHSRSVEVRLVGVLQPSDGVSRQALESLMIADVATAQELVGRPGIITRIDLILPEGYDLVLIEEILPLGVALTTPSAENDTLSQMTAAFQTNLQALSLLALVVGVFLIYNTVTFSVVQRRPVIGVMRSLGATSPQIFIMILGEAFILGTIGTLLGLGLGIIFGRAVVGVIAQSISDLYFRVNVQSVTLTPLTLLKGATIGLTASLLAALLPSLDATRTPPAGTLRRSDMEQKVPGLIRIATAGGVALVLFGLLMLQLPTQSIVISFVALFAILIGCALFTPLALTVLMRILAPLTGIIFGVLGRMAPRAVSRSLSRTSIAVAALTLSVSVIVGVGVMVSSFRSTIENWLDVTLSADVFISPPTANAIGSSADLNPNIIESILTIEGVERVEFVRTVTVTAPDYPDLPPVNLAAVSTDIAAERRFVWNNTPNGDHKAALQTGSVFATESFAFKRGITPTNNSITLLTDRGPQTFIVDGVYYDYSIDQGRLLMAHKFYRDYFDDPFISSLGLYAEPDADVERIIDTLRTETLVGKDLQAQSNIDLRTAVFEVFDRTFAITIALQVLATIVAFIGVLSAMMALQLEHAREYAVMRANGLTPRQLRNYTLIQTGLMGSTAGLMALPIGLVLAVVLIAVINVRSFGWTMELTAAPQDFVQAFAVALLAALAASLYPAWRLSRMAMVEALRSE